MNAKKAAEITQRGHAITLGEFVKAVEQRIADRASRGYTAVTVDLGLLGDYPDRVVTEGLDGLRNGGFKVSVSGTRPSVFISWSAAK